MNKHTIDKRKIRRDCFELDYAFMLWLKARLPVYLKDAGSFVDLEYKKFNYNGKELNQLQIVKRMIVLIDEITDTNVGETIRQELTEELLDLWKLVFFDMWW